MKIETEGAMCVTVDLAISKTASDSTPNVGDTTVFTLTVINHGTDEATNIMIDDSVFSGIKILAHLMTGGDCRNQAGPD